MFRHADRNRDQVITRAEYDAAMKPKPCIDPSFCCAPCGPLTDPMCPNCGPGPWRLKNAEFKKTAEGWELEKLMKDNQITFEDFFKEIRKGIYFPNPFKVLKQIDGYIILEG